MIRRDEPAMLRQLQRSRTRRRNRHLLPGQCKKRAGAEGNDDIGPYMANLLVQPVPASGYGLLRRRLVNATLATRLPVEMLDGIRDVDSIRHDAGALERAS